VVVKKLKERGLVSPYLRSFVVARINPLRWIKSDAPPLEDVLKIMRDRVAKFNVEKIKPQDLAGAAGPPDEETLGDKTAMPSSSTGHAGSGPASNQPTVPEPSYAERARTLMHLGRIGSLSTLSRKQPGFPFGSVMPYGLDDHGRPIFLISTMAMHTQNLQADSRASLLVTQNDAGGNPLGASRVTLVGNVLPMLESEVPEARKLYLARYANSKYWVDFEDFSFHRMDPVDVYYVGGFGVMGWVSASEYDRSKPDPLADSMAEIIRHMNADHKDALVLLAREFAGHRVAKSDDDSGRSPRVSCANEDPGWHSRRPNRISAGGKQSSRSSKCLGPNGATGALAGGVNCRSGTQMHTGLPKIPAKAAVFD